MQKLFENWRYFTNEEKVAAEKQAPEIEELVVDGKTLYKVNYGAMQNIAEAAPAILNKEAADKFIKLINSYQGVIQLRFKKGAERPAYDEKGSGTSRGAKSMHKTGGAVDLVPPETIEERGNLMAAALDAGFGGFGFGAGSFHIDIRPTSHSYRWWVYPSGKRIYNLKYKEIVPYFHPRFQELVPTRQKTILSKLVAPNTNKDVT